jgi:hypothetical protein
MKRVSSIVTLACLLNPCSPIQNEKSPATASSAASVCAVQREPDRFVGRSVWLRGQLEGDGMHWITLTDPSCHDFGLEIEIAKDFKGNRDYLEIMDSPKAIAAIVKGEYFGYLKKKAKVLVLKKATHIEIQPK